MELIFYSSISFANIFEYISLDIFSDFNYFFLNEEDGGENISLYRFIFIYYNIILENI